MSFQQFYSNGLEGLPMLNLFIGHFPIIDLFKIESIFNWESLEVLKSIVFQLIIVRIKIHSDHACLPYYTIYVTYTSLRLKKIYNMYIFFNWLELLFL
jgi:hypothetical protein